VAAVERHQQRELVAQTLGALDGECAQVLTPVRLVGVVELDRQSCQDTDAQRTVCLAQRSERLLEQTDEDLVPPKDESQPSETATVSERRSSETLRVARLSSDLGGAQEGLLGAARVAFAPARVTERKQ
jgi:hypothetical protein